VEHTSLSCLSVNDKEKKFLLFLAPDVPAKGTSSKARDHPRTRRQSSPVTRSTKRVRRRILEPEAEAETIPRRQQLVVGCRCHFRRKFDGHARRKHHPPEHAGVGQLVVRQPSAPAGSRLGEVRRKSGLDAPWRRGGHGRRGTRGRQQGRGRGDALNLSTELRMLDTYATK